MMEREGQVNTQFQQRHFVLWPRDYCQLVGRSFRVLFYFEGPEAPKAKGRMLIDNPGVLDLTRERDGEFVRQIIPDETQAADAELA